ncbi:hypothetical protein MS3_00009005 [Schistosoma haematobium]|uniref:Egg protein CP391S-like protein n=1 Tax=Schistosoma haematobium TaxID=6185 RepID=A0A922LE53_SCHHA|nr:hypothetical protein MS3_00009005 [Schistosoma haematobium]KAH9580321.1 hypothetical protein MS3_00009005 [Schistosoma haematobium]
MDIQRSQSHFLTVTSLTKPRFFSSVKFISQDKKVSEINVPKIWIQNGTLVEWEPLGECSKHDSTEACPDPLTSSTTCIWCETVNMCITSNDKDLHEFKVNGCKNKILIANVPTEPTTLATTETDLRNELEKTSGSIESHLNMTKDTTTLTTTETDLINELKKTSGNTESHLNVTSDITEDIEKRKSLPYVYIVVPLVLSFLTVGIGCGIWLLFYRRKRVYP